MSLYIRCILRRPLREVVSWNWNFLNIYIIVYRRPLREVVSWNAITQYFFNNLLKSTSSWGRELKSSTIILIALRISSTSSWGRELKYLMNTGTEFLCWVDLFVRSWVEILKSKNEVEESRVDLFVRSWVEMLNCLYNYKSVDVDLFVRSWVEIHIPSIHNRTLLCRPLREVVSWNHLLSTIYASWVRRPLREVVSWNIVPVTYEIFADKSTSSWGRELK